MKAASRSTRRQFVQTAAATAAAATIVPRHVLGGPKFVPPSEKVNVALIGAGGQGRTNLKALFTLDDVQVTALADPCTEWDLDRFYYKGKAGRLPIKADIEKHYADKTPNFRVADYEDFRVMLDKQKSIDAVLIATPDHLHGYVSLLAMRQGKHTYCEKPLTHNIREARLLAQVAKQTGVATQMGNIGHSRDGIRQTCEWIWAGAIGTVREVHSWVPAKRWNPELTEIPQDTPPVPAGLNWDLWLGPREHRPWHPVYTPVSWRDFWAFGTGGFGDFGCHDMDAPCWALDLQAPESVEAYGAGKIHPELQPQGLHLLLPLPCQRSPAGRQVDLVRQRPDAGTSRRLRPHPIQVSPRGAVCRRQGLYRLRRSWRTAATGVARQDGNLREAAADPEAIGRTPS